MSKNKRTVIIATINPFESNAYTELAFNSFIEHLNERSVKSWSDGLDLAYMREMLASSDDVSFSLEYTSQSDRVFNIQVKRYTVVTNKCR